MTPQAPEQSVEQKQVTVFLRPYLSEDVVENQMAIIRKAANQQEGTK